MIGEDQCAGINADISEDVGLQSQILRKVVGKVVTQISRMQPTNIVFEMGQVDIHKDRKVTRGGPNRSNGKGKNNIKTPSGPTNGNVKTTKEEKKSPRRRSWTRLYTGSRNENGREPIEVETDPKRKCDALETELSETTCMKKKQRLYEETRSLSILMATHLGSAEAAMQPYQGQ